MWRSSVVALLLMIILILAVFPSISFAQLPGLDLVPVDLGSTLPGLPQLPLDIESLLNLSPASPLLPANPAAPPDYSGSAEGSAAGVNLPADLGGISLNSATGAISSDGGLLPDNPGTPQDESLATAAGGVDLASLTSPLGAFGIGSAGSAAPPDGGIINSLFDFSLPGMGGVKIGWHKSVSSPDGTANGISLIIIEIEALDLNLAIPVMQSQANSQNNNGAVESNGSTDLIASEPGEPLVIGSGLAEGEDLAALSVLNAGSTSNSDGDTAGSSSYWTIADVAVAGMPLLAANDESGLAVAGATLLPAPEGENSTFLAVEDPLLGLGGVFIGEKQNSGDGTNSSSGAANIIRIELLGVEDLVSIGHAESTAGVGIGVVEDEDDDDDGKDDEDPIIPGGFGPPSGGGPGDSSISSGPGYGPSSDDDLSRAGRLPFTGMSLLLIAAWLAALGLGIAHFMRSSRGGSTAA